jgi:hypothetical protein
MFVYDNENQRRKHDSDPRHKQNVKRFISSTEKKSEQQQKDAELAKRIISAVDGTAYTPSSVSLTASASASRVIRSLDEESPVIKPVAPTFDASTEAGYAGVVGKWEVVEPVEERAFVPVESAPSLIEEESAKTFKFTEKRAEMEDESAATDAIFKKRKIKSQFRKKA